MNTERLYCGSCNEEIDSKYNEIEEKEVYYCYSCEVYVNKPIDYYEMIDNLRCDEADLRRKSNKEDY